MQQSPLLSDFHPLERPRERKSSRRRNGKRKDEKKPSHRRAKSNTQLVKDTANQIRLYAWHELESWQQDNEFLHSGYRKATNSYRQSLASLSYIHNQTANIYSHLIGAFLFICFGFFVYLELVPRYQTADAADLCIFAAFGAGAMLCFGLSAFFHTVGNHSEEVYHSWLLLDLYGILGLICGTVYSGVFYGFYCERSIWVGYSIEVRHVVLVISLEDVASDVASNQRKCSQAHRLRLSQSLEV
jgi:adiponectin receptor